MKEKDDKIGDLVNRFNDMECRELEKNQPIKSLLRKVEAVDETIDFVNNLSNPDKVYSVLICNKLRNSKYTSAENIQTLAVMGAQTNVIYAMKVLKI